MAKVTLYPTWENNSGMRNVNGNSGIYREMEDIQVLADPTLFAHWGNEDPGPNYSHAVASINGGKYKPSQIEVWNFHVLNHIPANARVISISVEWAYAKFAYPNMGHGSFGQPVISIPQLGLNAAGNAPPKDVVTAYNVKWNNLKVNASELNDVRVTFDLPMNTSNNPAYVKMKYLRLNIEYIIPNFVPSVSFQRQPIRYGEESQVTVEVLDTNNAVSTGNAEVTVIVTPGLKIVSGSINAQGTYTPGNQTWRAKITNGRAKLTFRVTPNSPSDAGYENVNAYVYVAEENRYNQSVESIYIVPGKAYLLECSVSENAIKQSLNSRHYTLFTLTVQNDARTPLEVYLDFDKLKINGSLSGYNSSTKILTINNWDSNNLYDIQLQLYSTALEDAQIICYSKAWTGVTKIKVNVNEEFDYEEYYTELDAPLFTLENMYRTNGEEYVFGCLCRITGTSSIIKGMKNVRASVINNGEKFTPKVSQIGNWQWLTVKFKYNESKKLSFRFYGNYIEADQGKIEFGNLFVIHADHYQGYEYPALAFDDLNKLITNDEYTNLLLEPPEKNPSSKHYFDLINWNGLEDNEFIIPHGLEITGDISAEESVNLLMGFGHTGIDELDYHKESLNINENTRNFKFGGKFKTLGLNFPDITSLLKDMVFFMQIDDSFDNQTPVNVQMKNVRITLYYSINNDCWEFFVNGVSSKHFLLDLRADGEIPRGANYDVNKFQIDGADGEYPNRINLEENKIKLKFDTCECGTIEDLTILLEAVVEWLYPERDSLDNPILKTISFFYAPEVGYDYYIEDTMDAEPVDGAYECEAELIVPSGLARNLKETESSNRGHTGHMGKVKPTIIFNVLSHNGEITLIESETNQRLTLTGEFINNLPVNTLLKLDCENRKLYYEAWGEWFTIDPNAIALDSDFFILAGYFDFTTSTNCKVIEVRYYELKG
ncbi:hypothetical protein [uncultured Methanobrevibacter sp.]|uniref:hypothetical protein n=1 Tax=uncultured Methanobrevibacter sp. TaxID=253161 RepID=UPI0025E9AFC8|nr:hypothetical protein [uncultured Methanobrevibacter sp.]